MSLGVPWYMYRQDAALLCLFTCCDSSLSYFVVEQSEILLGTDWSSPNIGGTVVCCQLSTPYVLTPSCPVTIYRNTQCGAFDFIVSACI